MPYITVPFDTQAPDLADEAFAYIEEQIAGWLPANGNLESILVEALAQLASELRVLCALVPDAIFEYFGDSVLGIAPYPAIAATGTTTWTAIDANGYVVEAGALVAITPPASTTSFTFQVQQTFTIPSGQTVATGVLVQAVDAGAASSGINGVVSVIDPLDFIESVTLDAATTGGQDAETTDAYLNRLSDVLTLLTPRPILPQDFAILAQRSIPDVARATAIDLYNPGPPINPNCPRCVTVVCLGADGLAVSAQTKADVDALLQSMREVNFLVFVADPTYTQIDVSFTAKSFPGYDAAEVNGRVIQNLTNYLSPWSWGVPTYGDPSARSWINQTTVRYLELSTVINNTDGVDYTTLQLAKHGSALGTADVVMTGVAPLPTPGTITGTTTAEA